MKNILSLALVLFIVCKAFAQTDEDALAEIKKHRDEQEAEFRNPEKSPLEPKDRKHFKGLNFYAPDLKYRVKATFVKNETPVLFKMKTSTSRLPEYLKYGEVHFALDSQEYKLEVYQSPDISKDPQYKDYLFIPFTDNTNGHETYDVGRYIDMTIPATAEVIVDFNQCYNPYCSYRDGYSCPVPPVANALPIAIPAGEKKFREHH